MTSTVTEQSTSIFSLLIRAADTHGDRPVIEFQNDTINYHELLDRSLRLAAALSEAGAAPGTFAAFSFKKSIDAIVALFAIARTGATYVPLDPTWPVARLQAIRAAAPFDIWTGSSTPPLELGSVSAIFTTENGTAPARSLESITDQYQPLAADIVPPANDIANVLFTSGSTGTPKGVQITTRSLLHFARWGVKTFGLTPADRLANHAPYNFDLSTFDIFAAVAAGACMCPIAEPLRMFPYRLAQDIAARGITTWYSVPSALALLVQRGKLADHDLRNLRCILFAGEVMPKPLLRDIAAALPDVELANLYGPTETNVCTWHRVTSNDLEDDIPLPIGLPIDDTRAWLLPEETNVSRSERETDTGELLIAGPTVTPGYLNDQTLTNEKLIAAPDGNGLAYRTGDRCRRDESGVLHFLGRIDRMIKARGHRIEPGEIEAALEACAGVKEVAVIAIADATFGNRIKACVSLDGPAPQDNDEPQAQLIGFARQRLPSYMVPDLWEFWEYLPRTERGKVDYQALIAGAPVNQPQQP